MSSLFDDYAANFRVHTYSPIMKAQKTMDPDVYDYLELCALAFGGIGHGMEFELSCSICSVYTVRPVHCNFVIDDSDYEYNNPCCIYGIGRLAAQDMNYSNNTEVTQELKRVGISRGISDIAIKAILFKKGVKRKVTWKEYCKALNIVRGQWRK